DRGVLSLRRRVEGRARNRLFVNVVLGVLVLGAVAWAIRRDRRTRSLERDLGEARQKAGALADSEERYRRLVESADDLIYTTDHQGRILYANPATREALGGDVEGRHFRDLVRGDYREEAARFIADQVRQGIPNAYCEFPLAGRGDDDWMGQQMQLVMNGERVAGFQAVARDITERKRAEQAVERKRAQLIDIVKHAPVAMALLDRQGHYLAHSAKWLKYLGEEGGSIIGRQFQDVSPALADKYVPVLERAMQGEVVSDPEDSVAREDGTRV